MNYLVIMLILAELNFNIDPHWIEAMIKTESSGNEYAISNKECIGLMQIHEETARDLGFDGHREVLFHPYINMFYGISYLKKMNEKFKNIKIATDAYNRGPRNVTKYPYKGRWEDHRYVGKVLKNYQVLWPKSP